MFRRIALATAVGFVALSAGSALAQDDKDALEVFRDYATYGGDLALQAYVYSARTQYLGEAYGYYSDEPYLATYWSYQSAYYGYFGAQYEYRDWVAYAGDAANASRNYNLGIFEFLYYDIYPDYPYDEVITAYNLSCYAGIFALYAEAYFDMAVDVVTPAEDDQDGGDDDGGDDGGGRDQ